MQFSTPLRYPGGKGRLANYVSEIIELNDLNGGGYAEPFCGGAGIALSLLYAEKVGHIYLNDIDRSVFAFWHSAVYENEKLCRLIQDTPVNMDTWRCQRAVQEKQDTADLIDLGFSTFFLNRTNRSGILRAGVIGGKEQKGEWKIDARFVKKPLIERIELLGYYAENITVSQADVINFIDENISKMPLNTLVYFDPPYFNKGQQLYQNHYAGRDHETLADKIQSRVDQPWIVSYDNVAEIAQLYSKQDQEVFSLNYSAHLHTQGSELMVSKEGLEMPERVYTSDPPPKKWSTVIIRKTEDLRCQTNDLSPRKLSLNCGKLKSCRGKECPALMRSERFALQSRPSTAGAKNTVVWAQSNLRNSNAFRKRMSSSVEPCLT